MTYHEDPVRVTLTRPAESSAPLRVLMLHGLAGSASSWREFGSLADAGCELWAADLPWRGEGFGGWAQRHDASGWVLDAVAAVPGGPDVVIAHSFSATMMLTLLAHGAMPALRAAVFVAPFYRPAVEDFDWETISYYLNSFHEILVEGIKVGASGRVRSDVQLDMALKVRERVGPFGWTRFFDAYLQTPMLNLDDVTVPCLVVGGDHDPASFPEDSLRLAAALPRAEVHVLPGSGHFPMVQHPREFAGLVNSFLSIGVPG